jgi:hypothetical protein
MILEAGLLTLTLLAQASSRPVRTIDVRELACTRDGWCTEQPGPLDAAMVTADARRIVAGSTAGVLVLHEGAWVDGVDSGLGRIVHVELMGDLVRGCDAARCVDIPIQEGRFGTPVPSEARSPGAERPGAQRVRRGSFGEGGRYSLSGERLRVTVDGKRVLSRKATDVLGAEHGPLWVAYSNEVIRYSSDGKSPVGKVERFPVFCDVWCGGWNGRLAGSAEAPVLQLHHHSAEGLYRFDGERFVPMLSPGSTGYKEGSNTVLGEGCGPCLVGAWRVAIRRPGRWVIVPFPELNAPSADRAQAVGLDAEGWPTVLFNLADVDEPARLQAWAFDGTQWTKGAKAKTVRVPRWHPERPVKSPSWATQHVEGAECTAQTPWGERWMIRDNGTLEAAGSRGRRVERLPQRTRYCNVVPGEEGVFIFIDIYGGALSKRWERLDLGTPVAPERFRVVDVAAGDVLHVRRGPDPAAGVVARLEPGACVEGKGLKTSGSGGTWLKLGAKEGEGWANARYLKAEPCGP